MLGLELGFSLELLSPALSWLDMVDAKKLVCEVNVADIGVKALFALGEVPLEPLESFEDVVGISRTGVELFQLRGRTS